MKDKGAVNERAVAGKEGSHILGDRSGNSVTLSHTRARLRLGAGLIALG